VRAPSRSWRVLPPGALAVTRPGALAVTRPGALAASLLAALAVSLLAACGSGGSGAASASPPGTRQVHVSPVTAAGAPVAGYRVTSRAARAQCSPGSEAVGQAYRCFAGNTVYDPCWAERAGSPTVLCVADPWLHTVAELRVRSPLGAVPAEGGGSPGEPWGVQLAGGQRCVLAQGAHGAFDGVAVDYYCAPGLSLLRGLDRGPATWTARSVIDKSGKFSAGPAERIAIAWYGSPARFR
jgi:hypothetical protein